MQLLGIAALVLIAATALADPFGPPVKFGEASASYMVAASTTAGPVAVWREDNGSVRANGSLVAASGVRIAADAIGDFVLVVWTEADGRVMAARRRADGTAAGAPRHIASNANGPVAVSAAGDRYLVSWRDTNGAVSAAIVSTLGDPLVPAMPVSTQFPGTVGDMAAAASADGFAIVWDIWPERYVFAITLGANGTPASMTPLVVSDEGLFPDVTSDGETFFVAWSLDQTLHARTLTVDRTLGRLRTIGPGAAPRVAWDGSAYSLAFVREVRPRPGFLFHQLATMRVTVYGTYVEQLYPTNTLVPRAFDVDALDGRLDLANSTSGVEVQSATVREPRSRIRALRH